MVEFVEGFFGYVSVYVVIFYSFDVDVLFFVFF